MPPPKTIFTAHERSALKERWGSQSTRLTRDSFLSFGSCQLCLLLAQDPVCCPFGDLFCRECAVTNLLAQQREIKRAEKLAEKMMAEQADQKRREDAEIQARAVQEFENVQMGLRIKTPNFSLTSSDQLLKAEIKSGEPSGTKRTFTVDEAESHRIASEDRSKARRVLEDERKAARSILPSFWIPGETPDCAHKAAQTAKQSPICPASEAAHPHPLSLKVLIPVIFQSEKSDTGRTMYNCPSCTRVLSNNTKALVAIPCGHVLCRSCVEQFMTPERRHHRDAHETTTQPKSMHCYVCDVDLHMGRSGKKGVGKERRDGLGLVEIRTEGTGFAGGGKAVVKRAGVAFQA